MSLRERRRELLRSLAGQVVWLGVSSGGNFRLITDVKVEVGSIERHPGGDYVEFRELEGPTPGLASTESPVLLDYIVRVTTSDGTVHRF